MPLFVRYSLVSASEITGRPMGSVLSKILIDVSSMQPGRFRTPIEQSIGDNSPKNQRKLDEQKHEDHVKKDHVKLENAEHQHHPKRESTPEEILALKKQEEAADAAA